MSHPVSSVRAIELRMARPRAAHYVAPPAGLPGRPRASQAQPRRSPGHGRPESRSARSPHAAPAAPGSPVERNALTVTHAVDVPRYGSLVRRLPREQVEERSAAIASRIRAPRQPETFVVGLNARPTHREHTLAVETPEPRRYAVRLRELAPPTVALHRSPGRNSRQSVSRLAYLTAYDSAS